MANKGKFFDRNPQLISAGLGSAKNIVTVKDCLQSVSLEDKVTALKQELQIPEEEKTKYPTPKIGDTQRYAGFDNSVKQIFHAGLKPPFQYLEDEMKETTYASYWKSPLGRSRDQTPGLPEGLDPHAKVFGMRSKRELTAAELVSPQKLPGQVLFESNLAHELYVKSHQDYYPGERVNRGYEGPAFNPKNTFGSEINCDFSGKNVKRVMNWKNNENTTQVDLRLANYIKQNHPQIGKTYEPNHILGKCIPEDHRFGKVKNDKFGVSELIRQSKPYAYKKDIFACLKHINALRKSLNSKQPPFDFEKFLKMLKYYDKENKGWLPVEIIHEICDHFAVHAHKEKMEEFIKFIGIMDCNNYVDYKKLYELLNLKYELPTLKKIEDVPPEHLSFETTYQALLYDKADDYTKAPTAGVPTERSDVAHAVANYKFEKQNLGQETDVRALVNPSLFTQYGLSHRDFFKPRDKDTIHNLFLRIGVQLPPDLFETIWNEAYKCDNSGGVCIETFRNFLDKLAVEQCFS